MVHVASLPMRCWAKVGAGKSIGELGMQGFWRGSRALCPRYAIQQGSPLPTTQLWGPFGTKRFAGISSCSIANAIWYPFGFARTRLTLTGAFVNRAGHLGCFRQIQDLNPKDKGGFASFIAVNARAVVQPFNCPFDTVRRCMVLQPYTPAAQCHYEASFDCFTKLIKVGSSATVASAFACRARLLGRFKPHKDGLLTVENSFGGVARTAAVGSSATVATALACRARQLGHAGKIADTGASTSVASVTTARTVVPFPCPFDTVRRRLAIPFVTTERACEINCVGKAMVQGVSKPESPKTVAGAFARRAGRLGRFKQSQDPCNRIPSLAPCEPFNYPIDTARRHARLQPKKPIVTRHYKSFDYLAKMLKTEGLKRPYKIGASAALFTYDRVISSIDCQCQRVSRRSNSA